MGFCGGASVFGPTACLVRSAAIAPAGYYSDSPNGIFVAGGPFWAKNATEERAAFNRIILWHTGAGASCLLATQQNSLAIITASDTGLLVTAVALGCRHGLPANFGVGRGNWLARDVDRINISFIEGLTSLAPSHFDHIRVDAIAVATGNLTLCFQNNSKIKRVRSGTAIIVEYVLPGYGRS